MNGFQLFATLLSIVAILSYVNDRYVRLPTAIGLMAISLTLSLSLIGLATRGFPVEEPIRQLLDKAQFSELLMRGLLSFLLFAGAIQFRFRDMAKYTTVVAMLATVGVAVSTALIGTGLYFIMDTLGHPLPWAYCFLFGALISPTDPVAVLAILRRAKLPKSLEAQIVGESLFNDGVAVVLFVLFLGFIQGTTTLDTLSAEQVAMMLLRQVAGGIIYGFLLGALAVRLLRGVTQHTVEILLTLATACGGYALAEELKISAPIAVVVAGLIIGNESRSGGQSGIESFWSVIDELLNSVLFVWIGLVVFALSFTRFEFIVGLWAIPLMLMGRLLSIWLAAWLFGLSRHFNRKIVGVMTWGGLRGGVSVALALSIPVSEQQDILVSITYVGVVFSILIQGLTIGPMIRRVVHT